jgi:hypothetical protein
MTKRITLLIAALMLALSMSFSGVALAGGHHGCSKHSQGYNFSHGKCHHKDKHGGGGGGDDPED